jgi:protein SCO1/2
MRSFTQTVLTLLSVAVVILGVGVAVYLFLPHETGLAAKHLPDVTLTDDRARPFTFAQLHGTEYALFFGYTHCPDTCPATLAKLERAREALDAAKRDTTAIVFVTVDPERDTPAVLHRYVGLFGSGVVGVTGSPAALNDVERSLGVWAARIGRGKEYEMGHTSTVFFIDGGGHIRSLHDYTDAPTALQQAFEELS